MGGANQCEACPPGTISNGILGCDDPASAGMIGCGGDSCMDCPPGTYAPADGGGEYCMMCPQGTYSMGGSHQCEECPPNLMSNGIYTCDDGSFMNECGGDSCVDCAGNPWGNAYLEWNDDFTFEECIDIDNITGCTYSAAYNFNIDAINDDGSCSFPCPGDFNEDNSKDILDIIILLDDILNYVPCP